MKNLFCLMILGLISLSSLAAVNKVSKIRSFSLEGSKYQLTFWDDNRVYKIDKDSPHVPCLENSRKSERPVQLTFGEDKNSITDCKMSGDTHPGKKAI